MNDYETLLNFLTHWYECRAEDLAWNGSLPTGLHSDVEEFYRCFGVLTLDNGPFCVDGLASPLAAQDWIVPAPELVTREDGAIILIHENQDCWTAGQMPNSKSLWSSIDLEIGDTPYPGNKLYDMGLPLKQALITHVLHETVMSSVDAGPAFNLKEWDAIEDTITKTGKIDRRAYITPDEGTLRIGWTSQYMASSWGDDTQFTWIVRRGDRTKGNRPTPYTVGKPKADLGAEKVSFIGRILGRYK